MFSPHTAVTLCWSMGLDNPNNCLTYSFAKHILTIHSLKNNSRSIIWQLREVSYDCPNKYTIT